MEFDNEDFLFKGGDTVILTLSPAPVDAAIASANMELVANSLGIGMVYVGYFVALVAQSPRLRQWIGLQESDRVVTCLSMAIPPSGICAAFPANPCRQSGAELPSVPLRPRCGVPQRGFLTG